MANKSKPSGEVLPLEERSIEQLLALSMALSETIYCLTVADNEQVANIAQSNFDTIRELSRRLEMHEVGYRC